MSSIQKLRLDEINIQAGTQSRAETNNETVDAYAEALEQGAEFPPVVVFSDGTQNGKWLADGFHRYLAHLKANLAEITCDIRAGTLRDAKLFSNGANGTHGLPRTNADKHRAVMNMLADDEWKTWSQERIAKACCVSTGLVSKIISKASLHGEEIKPTARVVERNGKTYQMDTAKIGKAPAPAITPPAVSLTAVHGATPASASAPSPTLMQQVLEQPAAASDAPAPAPGEDDDPGTESDPFEQLIEENKALERGKLALAAEVHALNERIAILTRDDLAAAADEWKLKFEQLSGRNRQLQQTARDAQLAQKFQAELLAKIRAALGVESSGEILPALTARRAA